jgi:hypothetical protein
VKWECGDEEEKAFDNVRTVLTFAPIIGFPDFSREFTIQTDASGQGIGTVLSQIQNITTRHSAQSEEKEVVITYTLTTLTEVQVKWSVNEKVAHAVIHAV